MSRNKTPLFKKVNHKFSVFKRSLNSGSRVLPNFLIIGAAKSGTTSLFHYLIQHPQVIPPFKKEIHFFDKHFNKGIKWYQLHFPTRKEIELCKKTCITGEATPYYISHPLVPQRVKSILPNVKCIVLLRNPIDRAFSNYNHMVRMGYENESFEKAIALETDRTSNEIDILHDVHQSYSFKHHHYSYLSRSIYHIEIKRWFNSFDKTNFLFLNSEEFYQNPEIIYYKTLEFLNLDIYKNVNFHKLNSGGEYNEMRPETRNELRAFFKPHNEKLYQLIETEYNWNIS